MEKSNASTFKVEMESKGCAILLMTYKNGESYMSRFSNVFEENPGDISWILESRLKEFLSKHSEDE
jgi:hypothetical protein